MIRRALAGVLVAALAVAGCGGSSHSKTLIRPPRRAAPLQRGNLVAHTTPGSAAIAPRLAGACSTDVSGQAALTSVPDRFLRTPPQPFSAVSSADGRFAFVSVAGQSVVLVVTGVPAAPRVVRSVAVPALPLGAALTPDGHELLLASGGGALVLSVAALEQGGRDAVLGRLAPRKQNLGGGAIEVTASRDSRYVFVSLEGLDRIAVYDLHRALLSHFHGSLLVGTIPTGVAPVGLTVSPDGRWLYATSELRALGQGPNTQGTVSAISVARAIRDPAHAVAATVSAGCGPVRIATIDHGSVVLVTARESDELLAFSASGIRSGSARALIAAVRVGEAPVGLAPANGGSLVAVADSNRFHAPGARAALTIVNTADMLAGRPSIVGQLPAGGFPRDVASTPDGRTLFVADFDTAQMQVVDLAALR